LQRVSASPENAARMMAEFPNIKILDMLPKISCPTIVLHSRDDGVMAARSRSRLATLSIESSVSFVASTDASIATGWNEPVAGRELHPLKSSAFSRRTVTPTMETEPREQRCTSVSP
jgi:hypothetical protein